MYGRKDKSPRLATQGFEHPNNFVLFGDGQDVFVNRIDNDESLTTNLVQHTKAPLSSESTHFTMTIVELTENEFIMFGLTNKCVPGNPLWTIDRSLRYHSNDGGVFNGGLGVVTYAPYGIGDKITCRLDYTGPDRCLVNFLKNGSLVYRQWVNLPPGELYPTIGVSRTQAKLKVDWPSPGTGDINIRTDLPSNWFGWSGLVRSDEDMIVTLDEIDKATARDAYNIQSPTVLSKDFSYFEIELLHSATSEKDSTQCQAIGLVAGNCEPFVLPGWTSHSIGYHTDEGKLHLDGDDSKANDEAEPSIKEGDRLGCGIIFPNINPSNFRGPILVLIYFTKNGELLHKQRMRQPRGGFFPCVGFSNKGDSIKLNVQCPAPAQFEKTLVAALNLADVSSDFRCSEVVHFTELAADSAAFQFTMHEDNPQLIQYLGYPLSNIGDGFSLEVQTQQTNTEIQLGVSVSDHAMEGEFLGSNPTSCGYLLKLGSLAMKSGMRTVSKWNEQKDIVSCYLDFKDETLAVICFEKNNKEFIGRATVTRQDTTSPLYASVVMSAGPCVAKISWARSIYTTHHIDRDWGDASTWLKAQGIKGDKHKLTLQASESYAFASCAQCRQPMLTGTSYFGIKLLGGESLPGIGLSKATTDVNNVLGSETGEVCFFPSSGEMLIQNYKWHLKNAPTFQKGDTLQCGFVFAEADRVEQKGVVYFCHNNQPFFHCRFTMAHGGAYPAVALSSKGCCAEVLQTSRAQLLPESQTSEWLNEDRMEGVEPCLSSDLVATSSSYKNGTATYNDQDGELKIMSSENEYRTIYISYTMRDMQRVDPILNFLQRQYLNFEFVTSTKCVELSEKQSALQDCELILIFMSNVYSESHEMAMEYSLFEKTKNGVKAKPVLVAAERGMTWPPENYFKGDQKITSFPLVSIASVDDKDGLDDLTTMLDNHLNKMNMKPSKGHKKKQNTVHSNGNMGSPYAIENMQGSSKSKEKSSFCHIL